MTAVRRFDSPLRYLVASHSRPGVEHLVELDMYNGAGACQCEHFQYRLEPLLKGGAKPSNAVRCIHIMLAREKLIDEIMTAIKARQKENGTAKQEHQV